jgi:hypothetical protein
VRNAGIGSGAAGAFVESALIVRIEMVLSKVGLEDIEGLFRGVGEV